MKVLILILALAHLITACPFARVRSAPVAEVEEDTDEVFALTDLVGIRFAVDGMAFYNELDHNKQTELDADDVSADENESVNAEVAMNDAIGLLESEAVEFDEAEDVDLDESEEADQDETEVADLDQTEEVDEDGEEEVDDNDMDATQNDAHEGADFDGQI